jgi:hypothetical protein
LTGQQVKNLRFFIVLVVNLFLEMKAITASLFSPAESLLIGKFVA